VKKCLSTNISQLTELERGALAKFAPANTSDLVVKSDVLFESFANQSRCTGEFFSLVSKFEEKISPFHQAWGTLNLLLERNWGFRSHCATCTSDQMIGTVREIEELDDPSKQNIY
jgi:hypothetical protein